MKIVALIPAHNEEATIGGVIQALLAQTRLPDQIVVIPNGCTDQTANVARRHPVTVFELPKLEHKKSEALNKAWLRYCPDADLLVCLDADTILPPNAVADWESEFARDPLLAGSSSKFTMLGDQLLVRLQKAEFSKWTDSSLDRGWTSVLAGTGCCIRNSVLKTIVSQDGRDGPWSYDSMVEDFELTYQIRSLGYRCHVSPTVRAYTDAMKSVKTLWAQRMKWQVGTVEDLLRFGISRHTMLDWRQQAAGLFSAAVRIGWVLMTALTAVFGTLQVQWYWLLCPLIFIANDIKQSFRVPHNDVRDVLIAALLIPQEIFAWMRAGWFLTAWAEVLVGKVTKKRRNHWELQYAAEGI